MEVHCVREGFEEGPEEGLEGEGLEGEEHSEGEGD